MEDDAGRQKRVQNGSTYLLPATPMLGRLTARGLIFWHRPRGYFRRTSCTPVHRRPGGRTDQGAQTRPRTAAQTWNPHAVRHGELRLRSPPSSKHDSNCRRNSAPISPVHGPRILRCKAKPNGRSPPHTRCPLPRGTGWTDRLSCAPRGLRTRPRPGTGRVSACSVLISTES